MDAVERRLRTGRPLLLIIGDGIREGVEALTAHLQLHAGLHVGLALLDLSLWRNPDGGLFVVPRVPITRCRVPHQSLFLASGSWRY